MRHNRRVWFFETRCIADFAIKPFSSKRLQTYQVIETVFITNWAGFDPLN